VIAPLTSTVVALSDWAGEVPLVAVGCGTHAPLTSVAVDNAEGAAIATRYLLELGHETVHHIAGPASWLDAYERIAGWLALQEGQAVEPAILAGDWSSASGYEIGNQIASDNSVTGVLCANDHMALGLLRALSEHGRRVPGDVSVIGFDDIPEAAYFLPPLPTVRQNFGELGRRALSALVDLIHGRNPAGSLEPVSPRLVVRSSAGPPEIYPVDLG
jgi:DNA-binding LacI/PurR family transcriptional regulator